MQKAHPMATTDNNLQQDVQHNMHLRFTFLALKRPRDWLTVGTYGSLLIESRRVGSVLIACLVLRGQLFAQPFCEVHRLVTRHRMMTDVNWIGELRRSFLLTHATQFIMLFINLTHDSVVFAGLR